MNSLHMVGGHLIPDPDITPRQAECLAFVWRYLDRERRYPTQREICEALKISSSTADVFLDPLQKKDILVRPEPGPRNIRLTERGLRILARMGLVGQFEL